MAFDYLKSLSGGVDRSAVLSELMEAYGEDVWNYAYFLTKERTLADDLTQDVFLRVYERMFSYRGEASVKTWLLAITRNLVKDHWRSAWFRRVIPFGAPQREEHGPSAESEAMASLVTEEVWEVVLALPRKLREVLLLYAHHGLSYSEIASLLALSEGTVKSRLSRARAKVSQELQRRGGAEE